MSWSTTLTARSGAGYLLRPLAGHDVAPLTAYFLGLSETTRMLYAPHPFDAATAAVLCAEEDPLTLRLVSFDLSSPAPRIASYVILFIGLRPGDAERYTSLPVDDTCALAPSVRDDLQSTGLGSLVMPEVIRLARDLGMRRMILCGGVQARNQRGIHFYEKWGFRRVRDFVSTVPCYDMMRDL